MSQSDKLLRTLLLGGATTEYAYPQVVKLFGRAEAKAALRRYFNMMNSN